MALMGVLRANMTGDGDPEQVFGVNVTGNFFRVFRVPAHLGRTLEPGDEDAGEHAAVLSFGFWQRRFGGDPDVIGRAIQLDGEPVVVVGVMPESFTFPSGGDLPAGFGFAPVTHLWLPLQLDEEMRQNRGLRAYAPVGRARDGWSASELQAEMTTIGERFAAEYPETDRGWSFTATRLREQIIGDVRPSLLILSSAVGLVFLIACANVTNLVLAKALERQREVAVKTALGATRWRILRELVTEGLVLTGAAGLLGVVVASWILTLAPHVPFYLPYAGSLDARGTVAFFTLAVSLVTGLFLGVLPQWIVTPHAGEQLKDGARTSGTRRGHRLRGALVISEIAIASMLLVGAGLLVKSFVQLIAVDPGFRPDGALTFELLLPDTKYEPVERAAFYRELEERLAAAPGVVAAGAITSLPMDGPENLSPFVVEGQPPPEPDNAVMTDVRVATPGYFEAMRIPLLSGRTFRAGDDRTTSDVAIIDEMMARLAWPGEDPIGKRFITGMRFDDDDRWATVVGGRRPCPTFGSPRGRAAADLLASRTGRVRFDGDRAPNRRQAARFCEHRARERARDEPNAAALERAATRRARRSLDRQPAFQHAAAHRFRHRGAAARSDRHIRRDGLFGKPTHERDGIEDSARRPTQRRARARPARIARPRRLRNGARPHGGGRADPASIEPALSRRPARSRDLCGSLCSPSRNGRRRGDRAGKARDTGRPDGRFEVGVTAHPSHRVIFWRRPCQLQRWLTPLCPGGHSQQRVRRRTTRANHGPSSRVYRPNTPFAATVMPTRRNEGPSFCTIRAQPHQPLRATSPIASR